MARPTKFTVRLVERAAKYIYVSDQGEPFGTCAGYVTDGSVLPTIEGFASYLYIARDTVYDWCSIPVKPTEGSLDEWEAKVELHAQFSDIVNEIKNQQAVMLINGGLSNKYNATIAKLILSGKHGYVEKSEIDQNVSGQLDTSPANPEMVEAFTRFLKGETKA